jgi:amidophosphoribosyltransferase
LRTVDACEKAKGAYSIVFVTEDKFVVVWDPFGFRPLAMGRRSSGGEVFLGEVIMIIMISKSASNNNRETNGKYNFLA